MVTARKDGPGASLVNGVKCVPISTSQDIVTARQEGRAMAARLHFSASDLTLIATAISEVARNILEHAGKGELLLEVGQNHVRQGIIVVARDRGPGIRDVSRAMQVGYSSGKGLGLGLPGVKRLMDEFSISSAAGKGTTVSMKKWAPE